MRRLRLEMKKLIRKLGVVAMLCMVSTGVFAQKDQDKRPPKEPIKVVVPDRKDKPPQPPPKPKGDDKRGKP